MSTMTRKRKILITGILALCMTAPLSYYAYSWVYYYHYATDRKSTDIVFLWQWKLHAEGLRSAYQHDTYGGATPEETLQMFVAALREEKLEEASKYAIPEHQEKMLQDLQKGFKSGTLQETIQVYAKATSTLPFETESSKHYMSIETAGYSFDLMFYKNPTNLKWKIVSP